MPKVFAIYGKGGIGKSTTSSNLSVAFSKLGKRVPADRLRSEARLNLHADQAAAATVIDVLESVEFHAEELRPEDFVYMKAITASSASGRRATGRHWLRRLRRRSDRQAAQRTPPAR